MRKAKSQDFAQITNTSQLFAAVEQIHLSCHKLCKQVLGRYLPIAGNIAIFCHYDEEFKLLTKIREELTEPSDNPNQKYYQLRKPIVILAKDDVPEATYTHLYIRKPDPAPEGRYTGDIDFVLDDAQYTKFKQSLIDGAVIKGVHIYDRPGWDMIELSDPNISTIAYISRKTMTEKVRVRF